MPEKRTRGDRRYRVIPAEKVSGDAIPEETEGGEGLLGSLSLITLLGLFITGIAGLVMGFNQGGVKGGLCLVAAALAFGLLAIALLRW